MCYGVLEEGDDMILDFDGGHQSPHHNQEEKQTEIGPGVLSKKTFLTSSISSSLATEILVMIPLQQNLQQLSSSL